MSANFACGSGQSNAGKPAAVADSRSELLQADTLPPQETSVPEPAASKTPAPTPPDSTGNSKDPRAGTPVLVEVITGEACRTAPLFINDQPAMVLAQVKNVKKIQLVAGATYRFRIGKMEKTVSITPSGESGKYQVTIPCE